MISVAVRASRSYRFVPVSLLGICLCWSVGVLAAAPEGKVTFRFAPPDGTTCVETVDKTTDTDMGSVGKRADISRVKGKTLYTKTREGYRLTTTVLEASATRNGKPVPDALRDGMKGLAITYEVDQSGQLLAVRGYDRVITRVRELFPEAAPALASVLDEQTLINRERGDWQGRVGAFAGQTVEIGDAAVGTSEFPLPGGGSVIFYSAVTCVERLRYAGHDCVKIRFSYDSDPADLGKAVGKTLSEIARAAHRPDLKIEPGAATIKGSGERIVDPATLLPYAETIERTITMPMEAPGHPKVTVVRKETTARTFAYEAK